ncbi:hypothetical protein BHE74_00026625 [Ensete ventricosum]|nr:hypothetical protein BHE74_00026625 [Ensete ventricosum]
MRAARHLGPTIGRRRRVERADADGQDRSTSDFGQLHARTGYAFKACARRAGGPPAVAGFARRLLTDPVRPGEARRRLRSTSLWYVSRCETTTTTSSASSSSSSPLLNVTSVAVPATDKDEVHVPVEIVSEEEMAFLEAALASTRSLFSSSPSPLPPLLLRLLFCLSLRPPLPASLGPLSLLPASIIGYDAEYRGFRPAKILPSSSISVQEGAFGH